MPNLTASVSKARWKYHVGPGGFMLHRRHLLRRVGVQYAIPLKLHVRDLGYSLYPQGYRFQSSARQTETVVKALGTVWAVRD
jgi:hypothetical protein